MIKKVYLNITKKKEAKVITYTCPIYSIGFLSLTDNIFIFFPKLL